MKCDIVVKLFTIHTITEHWLSILKTRHTYTYYLRRFLLILRLYWCLFWEFRKSYQQSVMNLCRGFLLVTNFLKHPFTIFFLHNGVYFLLLFYSYSKLVLIFWDFLDGEMKAHFSKKKKCYWRNSWILNLKLLNSKSLKRSPKGIKFIKTNPIL